MGTLGHGWRLELVTNLRKVFTITESAVSTISLYLLRVQLATIVMAGINDVAGVCVGGVLGHTICTGLAGQYCQHTLIVSSL